MAKSNAVINPNLGLYLDRAIVNIPRGGLQAGRNFRIQQGKLSNTNLGWSAFAPFTLNGAVTLIATMNLRNGTVLLIFGTPTDLYVYNSAGAGSVTYITPIYATGTAAASGTGVTGSGTAWNTGTPTNAKAGDEISFGSNTQNSTTATWYVIDTVNSDTSLTLHTSAGTVGAGTAYTVRRKFTATAADFWQYDVFVNAQPASEDRIYFTNGVDFPVRWNGADLHAVLLSTLGFTCKTLVVYKNQLLYANLNQGGTLKPTDLINSDVASPEVTNSGLAGQFKISGTADSISRIEKLGDYIVIYLSRTVIIANYVGDPLLFIFRTAAEGKGLQALRGLASYPEYHEFIGADTLYTFDGNNVTPISNHVWRDIIRTEDPARAKNVFTVRDEHRGDYIWSIPLTTDAGAGTVTSPPFTAYTHHYLETVPQGMERPYSTRDFPFTSAGYYARQSTLTWDQLTSSWQSYNFRWNDQFFAAAFPQIIAGDANGKIWTVNSSQDANGVAMPSFVRFGRAAVIDGRNRGLISRIIPFTSPNSTPLNVTANLADFAIGAATIRATSAFAQSMVEGLFFAPIYRVGRYVDVEFGTDGPAQPYELSGYDLDIKKGGDR